MTVRNLLLCSYGLETCNFYKGSMRIYKGSEYEDLQGFFFFFFFQGDQNTKQKKNCLKTAT